MGLYELARLSRDREAPADGLPPAFGTDEILYQYAFEESESALCLIDQTDDGYRVALVNETARQMIGGDRPVLPGQSLADVLPPQAAGYFRAILDACLERGGQLTIQDWIEIGGGRQYWIAVLKPLRGGPGGISRILLTGRNATDDQRAIGRLRRNRLLVERLAQTSPGTVYLYEYSTGLYTFLGAHAEQTLGHVREAGPRLANELIHPDDRVEVDRRRESLHRRNDSKIIEATFRMAHRDGSYRWLQSREMILTREPGEPVIVGVAIDVTAHIMAQDQVRTLSDRLTSLQDEERRRIAKELHDSTAQNLAAISLGMVQLRHLAEGADSAPILDDMQTMLTEAHRELSAITYLLHPPYLDAEGLEVSLRHFVSGFGKRTGLEIDLSIWGNIDDIPRDCATIVYRVVQEAITNVHRHAAGRRAEIRIYREEDRLRFSIADDGHGFAPRDPDDPPGIGVEGMRTRLAQLGGSFEIISTTTGTTVCAALPLVRAGLA
jgi:PAS domain S-box-containing protein